MADLFTIAGTIAINATVANQTIDGTMEKVSQLTGTLQVVQGQAESTGKSMGSGGKFAAASVFLGNTFSRLTEKGLAMAKSFAKSGFAFDASMEAFRGQFEALLNDEDKAHKLVSDLQLLAKVSPLGMEGLANNAVSLLNSGIALSDIIPTLEMLGDISLGDSNKMNSVVRAYTQILSKGQLMAQEMYQLGDAGVPVREIMTLYGGEEFADGSWYEAKMTDPTYKIPAEAMVTAFQAATSEGGKWHDYMFKMMDTWNGQVDRFGEEGKETLGGLMNPFFEMAKSDVLPKLMESLSGFGEWVTTNQDTLTKMAEAVSGLVTGGFDIVLNAFKWMSENGEAVGIGIGAIAVGLSAAAVAAHPLAASIMLVGAALAYLSTLSQEVNTQSELLFEDMQGYTEEEYNLVNALIEANNKAVEGIGSWDAVYEADDKMLENAGATELFNKYSQWKQANPSAMEGLADGIMPELPVKAKISEESEGELQGEVAGYDLEGLAQIFADPNSETWLQSYLDSLSLRVPVTFDPTGSISFGADGSHAGGLDRVPFDGYKAILHKDEAVLRASEAAVWRGEKTSIFGRANQRGYSDQPVTVNLTVNGVSSSPYEIAGEVRNALELLKWRG